MPRGTGCNKDYKRGVQNRQKGIFKKSNAYARFYQEYQVGVIIRHKGGKVTGYQSEPGFLKSITFAIDEDDFLSPDDFDTVADRQASGSSSGSSSPSSHARSPSPDESGSISSESVYLDCEPQSTCGFPTTPPMLTVLDAPYEEELTQASATTADAASVISPQLLCSPRGRLRSISLPEKSSPGEARPLRSVSPPKKRALLALARRLTEG